MVNDHSPLQDLVSLVHSREIKIVNDHSPLHIFFFPFLAHGHIIPTVEMAKLFAAKGIKATIITTPLNAPLISKAIENTKTYSNKIHIQLIKFPSVEVGLPEGCENVDSLPSPESFPIFFKATRVLQEPMEQLLLEQHPDCLVADPFLTWVTDSAAKVGIPRILFQGVSVFALCSLDCIKLYEPHNKVSSDSEYFVVPNLPGEIRMTRNQLPDSLVVHQKSINLTKFYDEMRESESRSYGIIVNSFYELEHVYADYYRNVWKRKAWHIGPMFLYAKENSERVNDVSVDESEWLKWLDTKKVNSVVYVCFGTVTNFPDSQLREIAMGLEASGHHFLWVVRRNCKQEDKEEWLPEGFEKRMEGKGLIIRDWAPQVSILEHKAVGAFVTHCGWNSTLEAVVARVPMVTMPVAAEQFFNEKLVTEMLKIGVSVGVRKWVRLVGDSTKCEAVEKAVKKIMAGEEAEEMRNRVKVLSQQAKRAVQEGGSSYSQLNTLFEELDSLHH